MYTFDVKMQVILTLQRTAYIYFCIPLSFVVLVVIPSLVTPWTLYRSYGLSNACNSVTYCTECA